MKVLPLEAMAGALPDIVVLDASMPRRIYRLEESEDEVRDVG
ncbi:MAG: hypothetical protein ACRDJV_05350 [Actinomycetota bacterium]